MAMQDNTTVDRIEYLGTDNRPRYALLNATDVHNRIPPFFQRTVDPTWHVIDPQTHEEGDFEWLRYFTQDGSEWWAKCHCRYSDGNGIDGPHIECWLEHKRVSGADNHDDARILFRDWEGHPWLADVLKVFPPFPKKPLFRLHRGPF